MSEGFVSSHEGSEVAVGSTTRADESRRDNIWSVAFPFFRQDRRHIRLWQTGISPCLGRSINQNGGPGMHFVPCHMRW
jgi:hypothetical protein